MKENLFGDILAIGTAVLLLWLRSLILSIGKPKVHRPSLERLTRNENLNQLTRLKANQRLPRPLKYARPPNKVVHGRAADKEEGRWTDDAR